MLAERPDRARLRPLLAHLLGKRHASADDQAGKGAIQHTVAMEIDLTAIGAFQEPELPGRIKPHHRSNRRRFMLLYLSLHSAYTLLQSAARPLERIVERKIKVGMPFVRRCGARDIDFPPVREREADVDLVKPASAVVPAGALQYDPASGHASIAFFEFGDTLKSISTGVCMLLLLSLAIVFRYCCFRGTLLTYIKFS